jgi:hypothetical protein
MKLNIKKPKSTFDELSTKYKKGSAYTKNRQNRNVQKVKPELPISPRQVIVSVAGRPKDSKQPKLFSKAKPHSQDRRERKLHATTLFLPFRHPIPKHWGPLPMMFHHYAPWFGWYALPMQYESFYPRSTKYEPNAFDSSAHPRKGCFYQKSWLNVANTEEQPNWTFQFS